MKPRWRYQFYLDRLGTLNRWRLLLVEVLLEPRDVWLGLYWTTEPLRTVTPGVTAFYLHLYLCVVPCLPLHVMLRSHRKEAIGQRDDAPPDDGDSDRYSFRRARGIIPWREGQERPEDIIRRGRGGDAS